MQTSLPWRDVNGLLYMGYWFLQEFYIKHQICNARSGPGVWATASYFILSTFELYGYNHFITNYSTEEKICVL
jgi:hypothetical protein